jgi:predicted nucleic-acid-binding Zn-ribbon protein
MRWPFRRARMVQRTCLDCGESWLLDARLAHLKAHVSRGFAADPLSLRGGPGSLEAYRSAGTGLEDIDQQLEVVRQLSTCPKCGSENYKDQPQPRSGPSSS